MPNENCLAGMKCPECESEGPFDIEVVTMVTMHDDGSEDCKVGDGMDWGPKSACACQRCSYSGEADDFREEEVALTIVIMGKAKSGKTSAALLLASRLQEYGAHTLVKDDDYIPGSKSKKMMVAHLRNTFNTKKIVIQTSQTHKMPTAREEWDEAPKNR